MASALDRICECKRLHVAEQKSRQASAEIDRQARQAGRPRPFADALASRAAEGGHAIIAEFKKASPSKGAIRTDLEVEDVAHAYERGGAACMSVLTDREFFAGDDRDLVRARNSVRLPVLRKDFIIDTWQVAESRMLGADCILVIMAALEDGLAAEIESAALDWNMDVLVEVHDETELERALRLRSPLLGINNRDLKSLTTSLSTTARLAPLASKAGRLVVAESGLHGRDDLATAREAGAQAFLIGESLMRQDDPEAALRVLAASGREDG